MAKRNKKSTSVGWLVVLALLAFAAAAGVAYFVMQGGQDGPPRSSEQTAKGRPSAVVTEEQTGRTVTVYVPEVSENEMYLVPSTRRTDAEGSAPEVALKVLVDESAKSGSPLPRNTRLLSPVKVTNGVATVNFSKEFIGNFSGGSTQEALTLNSIAHTLVDNSGGKIRSVRILVEGKTADTLGGHFDLTEPVEADSVMLKPGAAD